MFHPVETIRSRHSHLLNAVTFRSDINFIYTFPRFWAFNFESKANCRWPVWKEWDRDNFIHVMPLSGSKCVAGCTSGCEPLARAGKAANAATSCREKTTRVLFLVQVFLCVTLPVAASISSQDGRPRPCLHQTRGKINANLRNIVSNWPCLFVWLKTSVQSFLKPFGDRLLPQSLINWSILTLFSIKNWNVAILMDQIKENICFFSLHSSAVVSISLDFGWMIFCK